MAKGFKHGSGGASLNYKVVGNPQPANPRENTIWLNTDVPITGYHFSETKPETMTQGMVWIYTGTKSAVAFNVLKENSILVYPIFARQYIDGALADVPAKIYQGGEWAEWIRITHLYIEGDECVGFTGGWSGKIYTSMTKHETYMESVQSNNDYSAISGMISTFDFTEIDRVEIEYAYARDYVAAKLFIQTGTVPSTGGSAWSEKVAYVHLKNTGSLEDYQTATLDTTNFKGSYYVYFMNYTPIRVKRITCYHQQGSGAE